MATAVAFVTLWARPYDPPRVWREHLRPLASEDFAGQLAQVDPRRVPASRIRGNGRLLSRDAATARVRIATDGGGVIVDLVRSGAGWLVSGLTPDSGPVP